MNSKLAAILAGITTALVVSAGPTDAQRRGGGPPGGGPPGPGRGARAASSLEHITVHGASLEGNLEGDSPDRAVTVYLPPSYAGDQNRRFPVVYLLHGYTARDNTFTEQLARLQESGDRLAAAQGFSEMIVVTPDAYTLHRGSMYSDSVTTGNWERFVADDLVAYIDSHYRTLPNRMSRGLAGHSMGGYGAMRIGMNACCLDMASTPPPESMTGAEAIKTRAQAEEAARATDFVNSVVLALAAAWSPNPKNPPLFLDLPVQGGKARPEIVAKWKANVPVEMVAQFAANLNLYYSIAIDVGTRDGLIESNRRLHAALTRLTISHTFEEYDGDHVNRVRERLESNVLPFFSRHLAAPSNLTSPSPAADRLANSPK
jgi:enterochelin esterase-like enzyme